MSDRDTDRVAEPWVLDNPASVLGSSCCGTEDAGQGADREPESAYTIVRAGRPWTPRGAGEGVEPNRRFFSFWSPLHISLNKAAVSPEGAIPEKGGNPDLCSSPKWDFAWAGGREAAEPPCRQRDLLTPLEYPAGQTECPKSH